MSESVNAPKQSILNDFRMRLIGNAIQGADRPPSLHVRVHNNRPKIQVWTNVPNDKNKGIIEAELDPTTLEVFLNFLENAPSLEPGQHNAIKALDRPWVKGGRSPDLKPQSKTIVGKEQDGTIFICVLSWDQSRPVIKFPVRPSIYYQFEKSDGSQMDEASASAIFAPAWARMLRSLVFNQLREDFVPYQPSQNKGQNNQSSTQNNQQQASLPETSGDGWGNDGWSM